MTLHEAKNTGPVLIVCALRAEAAGIIRDCSLSRTGNAAFPLFESEYVSCVITGIGTGSVMRILPLAIELTSPSLIINAGSAGALSPAVSKNGVYEINRTAMLNTEGSVRRDIAVKTAGIFPEASLLTSPKPVTEDEERTVFGACHDLADMEGYAIAAVAEGRGIPASIIKIVSDTRSDTDELAIRRMIVRGGETLARETVRFLNSI